MKSISILIFFVLLLKQGHAQDLHDINKEPLFAFPVDTVIKIGDTLKIVGVYLYTTLSLEKDQAGVLVGNKRIRNDKTVGAIGKGKYVGNVGKYSYFIMRYNRDTIPQKGDLLYIHYYYPSNFYGRIFDLTRNAVYIKTSSGDSAYDFKKAVWLEESVENKILETLVNDIHHVASSMKKQDDAQDQLIKGGIFNGKKLFDAMEKATMNELKSFLDYVIARPGLYAAAAWNISEIFATWMTDGAPTVKKN